MNKRSRLIVIIAVLAICFAFLWPSLSWYAWTPKEEQALALSSLENIKDYTSTKAVKDVHDFEAQVKADSSVLLTSEQKWLEKGAKALYKEMGQKAPSPMTLRDALSAFSSEQELISFVEDHYRSKVLKNKNYYKNSVKLGLDLSGGMNVIVKADLDAVVQAQADNANIDSETLKTQAMAQAIETLSSRIDRFGLSSPIIRQQGEDRIYIELPGSAEADHQQFVLPDRILISWIICARITSIQSEIIRIFHQFLLLICQSIPCGFCSFTVSICSLCSFLNLNCLDQRHCFICCCLVF